LRKKLSEKSAEKVFYIYTNSVKKRLGKKARINFSRNTRIVRAKNVGEKIFGKKLKKSFFYSHEYRYQKMGGKTRETIFPETQE